MRTLRLLSAALLLAGLTLPAAAATFTLTKQGTSVFGSNGSAGASISEGDLHISNLAVQAGGFAVRGDLGSGAQDFTAWCVDIATYLRLPSQYTTTTSPFAPGPISTLIMTNVERLFETGYKTLDLTNANQSAGFQLALWEVLYEDGTSFKLKKGEFKVKNSTAIAFGQGLLDGMTGPVTQNYDLTYLQSDDARGGASRHYSQNLVTATPVPLPAGGLLLITALGGMVALRRRARKAA